MELIKQNENYTVVDTTESGWNVGGNVNHETNNTITINVNISNQDKYIGDFHYYKPVGENAAVHVGYNVSEDNRSEFVNYTNNLINQVLEQFNIPEVC
jgi:hypothetical protein